MSLPASVPVQDAVIAVLKNVSRRPIEPTLASDLVADLAFDSLQIMETIAELEGRFDISIPFDDAADTRTVSQIVARVSALVEGGPRQP
jgi:acyl carrier protein